MIRPQSVFANRKRKVRCAIILVLLAAVAFLFVSEGFAATAKKEEPPVAAALKDGDASKMRIVIISGLLEQVDIHPIERTIVAQLAGLSIEVDFHHVTTLPPTVAGQNDLAMKLMETQGAAAAFIIYPGESPVVLRILQKNGEQVEATSRKVDVGPGMPLHEALAVIVHAATTAIIDREKPPASIETAPRETAKSTPRSSSTIDDSKSPTSDDKVKRLYLEAGAQLGLFSRGVPPWLGMAVGLGWQPGHHWYIHMGYVAFSKVAKSAREVTLTLKRHPFHLGAGYSRPQRRLLWGGGVSLGIDYVTEEISSENAGWTLSPEGAEVHPALIFYLHMGVQILPLLSMFLNLGAEIPLSSTQYGIAEIEGEKILLELLPVQPVVTLGFRVHFF